MPDDINEVATPGGRIGARVAHLIASAVIHTRQQLGSAQSDVANEVFTRVTNHVSDEVRSAMGPLFHKLASAPGAPVEIQPLLNNLATQRGQAWGWIAGSAAGALLGGGLGDLITNYLNPVVKPLIAAAPTATLDPQVAANGITRGIVGYEEGIREGAYGGLDRERMETLMEMSQRFLTPVEAMELLRRGQISRETAFRALRRNGLSEGDAGLFLTMLTAPLSPETVAAAWARSLAEPDDVYSAAKISGVTKQDADRLMGLAGEPPPLEALITAWRRGIVTEEDVDRGIVQGPIRNEWIPVIKALQRLPLSPEDAASAVTQGHMTLEQGQAKAALSGIDPEDFAVVVENSGLPPGIEFAAEAFNRGLITDEQWTELFLESRIKNKHIPLMRAMRQNLIPAETVRMAYRLGTYPRDAARQTLMGHGFSAADAEAQLTLEDNRKNEPTKDLTRAQILGLYADDIIPLGQAEDMLRSVGYSDQEIAWQISSVEVDKTRRFINALLTKVRSAYVSGNIDETEVATLLDQAGVGITQRDSLIALWDLERQTVSASLTVAQITAATKKGFLQPSEGLDRLTGKGYSVADAGIILKLAGVTPPDDGEEIP